MVVTYSWEHRNILARGSALMGRKGVSRLLCVPEKLCGRAIRAHHEIVGHITCPRLQKEMIRRYWFAPEIWVNIFIAEGCKNCEVCHAQKYPNFQVKGPIFLHRFAQSWV